MQNKKTRKHRNNRSPLVFGSPENLEAHRELELLRVEARRPRGCSPRKHRRRIERRAKKLRDSRRDYHDISGGDR